MYMYRIANPRNPRKLSPSNILCYTVSSLCIHTYNSPHPYPHPTHTHTHTHTHRQFRELAADKEHFRITQEAIVEASTRAMRNPRVFTKPCTTTALAVAMATPLSVIVRSSLAATIAACVGCRDYQSKVIGGGGSLSAFITMNCSI